MSNSRLPADYRQLELRVDALRDVHVKLLKITKVYETESVSVAVYAEDWPQVTMDLPALLFGTPADISTTTPLTSPRTSQK